MVYPIKLVSEEVGISEMDSGVGAHGKALRLMVGTASKRDISTIEKKGQKGLSRTTVKYKVGTLKRIIAIDIASPCGVPLWILLTFLKHLYERGGGVKVKD